MRFIQPIVFVIIITLSVQLSAAADDDRGSVERIQSEYDGATLHRKFTKGTNHALIIGINKYRHHPDLKTAVNDARDVADLLEKKYFFRRKNILFLKNEKATRNRITLALDDLLADKVEEGDNIFIYYAGHGWYHQSLKRGYWVTTEAMKNHAGYLSNDLVYDYILSFDEKGAQHIFLVSDSCFSGSFLRPHRAVKTIIDDRYFRKYYAQKSRSILTSGGLEPVADGGRDGHSIFAYYFLKTLEENPHPYISVKQLGAEVEEMVTRNSGQTPVGKFIHGVGDEGGQFFFINKQS
ncbi:MAG: caspase family protein, partial [Desulfobacterales bacterium]|nr:caspase family protein [Desulfobacterales bacterium]